MEKKYQIFISSTFDDLKEERQKVRDTILSMYQFPIGMEMFSAADEEQWNIIKETIDSSDYYVVIIAQRYGSIIENGADKGISYTQKEFLYAKKQGIPILAFIMDDSVPVTSDKVETDELKKKRLSEFKEKAKKGRIVEWWKSGDELARKVAVALSKEIQKEKRPGWIRADSNLKKSDEKDNALCVDEKNAKLEIKKYPNLLAAYDDIVTDINNSPFFDFMGYYNQDELQNTIGTLMSDTICDNEINAENAILHHKEGVDLIPANLDLSAIEFSLVNAMSREFTLKNSIRGIKDNYDYVLIDCMPSLGMITINALACSDKIIIPVQGEYLAAKGMGHLLKTVTRVQKQINPNLKIGGVLLTLVDKRTNLSKDVRDTLIDNYGQYVKIYGAEIPKAINTAKSTSTGKSIFEFDKNSPVANAYNNLAKEVLENERTRQKDGTSKVR